MNESVLYEYIAEQLHTHVRIYNNDAHHLKTYTFRKDLHDNFVDSPKIMASLFKTDAEPRLCAVNNLLSYITVPVRENYCVIGPVGVCSDSITQYQLPTLVLTNELIQNLYTIDSKYLIRMGVFLYNLFADNPIDALASYNHNCVGTDISSNSLEKATWLLFHHEEYGEGHNPFGAEKREMINIENGDLQQLQESWREDYSGNIGILSTDPLRNAKYLSIINVALSSRAAVRGGLPNELAYSLSDAYCQQIDALSDDNIPQLEGIVRNIQVTYTKLVAQQRGGPAGNHTTESHLVVRAKDYIFSRLHGKLTVNDVAEALNTHPNYLNRIFKQTNTITVHDYILREKTNLVRNMLTYSDYSYIEIANYLGFSSQSHLGNTFKKFTGMTLKQYRDAYKKPY